jgi:hypothetical protein
LGGWLGVCGVWLGMHWVGWVCVEYFLV